MEENLQPKKKMSEETKAKLVYSGELVVIALVAIIIGILKLTNIRPYSNTARNIFNIVTSGGAIFGIYNFISYFVSVKKREKTALIDILTVLPITLFLIGFNIYCFITYWPVAEANITDEMKQLYQWLSGGFLIYAGLTFMFQGIYHYFKPIPLLYKILEEANQKAQDEEDPTEVQDNNQEPKTNIVENNQDGRKED